MRISAILACRNEEPFIQAWLEDTCGYAHEILIAINAPTDATADIIARFKPHSPVPIRCEWFPPQTVPRFGYSVMKNEMIARATGDWITSTDADEQIGLTPDDLRGALDAAMAVGRSALSLRFADHPAPEMVADDCTMAQRRILTRAHVASDPPMRKCKVFHNRAGFWWQGIIHEGSTRQGVSALAFCHHSDACLHHFGYLRRPAPEWKGPLYSSLICRARDFPHLRFGVNSFWYVDNFEGAEARIRAEAARLRAHQDAWFPEIPRREI